MSTTRDWLPASREGQLAMTGDWISVCTTRQTDWNIPNPALTELTALGDTAKAALETAKNETTRTPVATAQCKEAFDALTLFMRDFKRRYFLSPPLLDSGYISLGLKPHDPAPTPSGTLSAQVTVETYLLGRYELGVRIIYVIGSSADPANPEDLRKSFFTKRKKDVIEFDFGDSGKTAYFAVQIENEGKKGPWGPLVRAIIP